MDEFIEPKKMKRKHEKDKQLDEWVFSNDRKDKACPLDELYEKQFEDDGE